jgi:pyruvate formate lyase activating enzyme
VEFALRVMKLAKKNNLKNIWVSNGYMSKEILKELTKYLDAINIDLKGDQSFYDSLIPGISVEKIKDNIKYF